ncbi:MAG TPA: inner membrane-spanning protein YciB [Steroidobacteraceae bacterium]|jgi:intracellular septation protein|nr:inner membrane-spanning protein YciB [Steroidobacteraceae bacterium]
MHLLIDFLPLVAFLVAYVLGGIYVATAALMVGCALQIGVHWWRTRTVKPIHGITAVLALIFGTATLLLHDPRFIQWKVSVLMWLLALAFLGSQFIGRQPFAQRLLESSLAEQLGPVSARRWIWINVAWVLFFLAVGALNLYIARTFPDRWPYFKGLGVPGLSVLFMFAQLLWLPLRAPDESPRLDEPKS